MNSVVEHAAMFGLGSKMVKRAPEASPSVTFSHLILFHDSDHVFYISTVFSTLTLHQVHALPFFSLIKKKTWKLASVFLKPKIVKHASL